MDNSVLIYIACVVGIFIIGKIFAFPMLKILKLVLNSVLGGLFIFIINLIGNVFSFHIGLNYITSIFVGILGIPGAILLIILKLFLG